MPASLAEQNRLSLSVERIDGIVTRIFKIAAVIACTSLTLYLQVTYVTVEITLSAEECFERPVLYPNILAQVSSFVFVALLAFFGCMRLAYPRSRSSWKHLALAAMVAMTPAILAFEWLYFLSSLPAITPVSLSLALRRHPSQIMTPTLLVFVFSWIVGFFIMTCDANPPMPGAQDPFKNQNSLPTPP